MRYSSYIKLTFQTVCAIIKWWLSGILTPVKRPAKAHSPSSSTWFWKGELMDFTFSENDPLMRVGHGFLCNSFDFTDDELLILCADSRTREFAQYFYDCQNFSIDGPHFYRNSTVRLEGALSNLEGYMFQQKRLYKSQSREVRARYRDSYRIFMRILKRMRFQLAKRCSTLESLSEMESTAERELSRKATNA